MATYFDKSFFPYNPNSDIGMYGKAFHMAQPDLPKDLADAYYTRSWQDTDNYGSFQHTRMFLGMLNKFFDRPQDEARYFKSLSSTEQYAERSRLPQRDGDYYWSMRQTVSNKLGMLDESINPSVYRGDLNDDGVIDSDDAYYGVGQLIWSLVGRPGVSGRYSNQIQRDSMGTLVPQFLDGRIPDSIVQDMVAPIVSVDDVEEDLFQLTESQSLAYAQDMATEGHPLSDAALYSLAVLLATSQHVFLQGRRNLFGWANQGFNQWGSDSAVGESKTRQTILSTFNPQDQLVFDQQLAGDIDTDPLGAMIHDLSITLGDPEMVYRQQSVIRDSSERVTTWVFQSQPADDDEAPTWVGVSPVADGFEWQHGTYQNSTWTPNAVAVTGLSQLDRNSIERRLMAWDPLRTVIQEIMDGAVRYLQAQTGDDISASGLYAQSQTSIESMGEASDSNDAHTAYQQWLQAFPVATLYRALELAEGSSDTDFSTYKSVYTVESAGWTNPDDPGISISGNRRVFVDQGYFYRMNESMTQQLTADKRLFLNKGVAQSRANATYNERRRDKQAMKAAQWVRDYKAWRDEQDALLS